MIVNDSLFVILEVETNTYTDEEKIKTGKNEVRETSDNSIRLCK